MTIYSKKNNLLNYFIYDNKELSKNYVKKCKRFLENQLNNNKPKTKEFNLDQYKSDKLTLDYLNKKHSNEVIK